MKTTTIKVKNMCLKGNTLEKYWSPKATVYTGPATKLNGRLLAGRWTSLQAAWQGNLRLTAKSGEVVVEGGLATILKNTDKVFLLSVAGDTATYAIVEGYVVCAA